MAGHKKSTGRSRPAEAVSAAARRKADRRDLQNALAAANKLRTSRGEPTPWEAAKAGRAARRAQARAAARSS